MAEKVLITGGAGFIGSHVADRCLDHGFEVTILDDLSSGKRENIPDKAEFVEADIGSDVARDLVASGGFKYLNHHAAQMDVRVSVDDPRHDAKINIDGLLNLLEGARKGKVQRVVFASSGGVVYGAGGNLPYSEEEKKLPVSPYGVSKLASEYYLAMYRQLYGLETVALRYSNVYGPRQNPHGEAGVVAIFCNRILAGRSLTVFGDGKQTRDYVYVEDVAEANLAVLTGPAPLGDDLDASAFNVGTGVETDVNGLAKGLIDASGRDAEVVHEAERPGELKRNSVDAGKLSREFGWTPSRKLDEGLQLTFDWIAANQ